MAHLVIQQFNRILYLDENFFILKNITEVSACKVSWLKRRHPVSALEYNFSAEKQLFRHFVSTENCVAYIGAPSNARLQNYFFIECSSLFFFCQVSNRPGQSRSVRCDVDGCKLWEVCELHVWIMNFSFWARVEKVVRLISVEWYTRPDFGHCQCHP